MWQLHGPSGHTYRIVGAHRCAHAGEEMCFAIARWLDTNGCSTRRLVLGASEAIAGGAGTLLLRAVICVRVTAWMLAVPIFSLGRMIRSRSVNRVSQRRCLCGVPVVSLLGVLGCGLRFVV